MRAKGGNAYPLGELQSWENASIASACGPGLKL